MLQSFVQTYLNAGRITRARIPLAIPLCALLIGTVLLEWSGLDLAISRHFYDAESKSWPLADVDPWQTIDEWFVFPGVIIGVIALFWGLIACLRWRWDNRARAAVVLTWVLLIGPGLLVNGSLKPYFSRPRPREVVELGGVKAYQPAFGFGDKVHFNSSFPSGHASIGFFLITPAFLCRTRRWRWSLLTAGLCYGGLMSLSRIVQGGHYLSDTLWSLGIVYAVAWGVSTLVTAIQIHRIRPLVTETIPLADQAKLAA